MSIRKYENLVEKYKKKVQTHAHFKYRFNMKVRWYFVLTYYNF